MCEQVLCDQALAKSINKEFVKGRIILRATPPVATLGAGKSRREICVQERAKNPSDRVWTPPQMPSSVPADQDLLTLIFQMEREKVKVPKYSPF